MLNFWSHQSRAVNRPTYGWFEVTRSHWECLALSALLIIFTVACWCCGTNESSGSKQPIEPRQGLCEGEMGGWSAKVTFDSSRKLVFEQAQCSMHRIFCFQNSGVRNYIRLLPDMLLSDFQRRCVGWWASFSPFNMPWHVCMFRHSVVATVSRINLQSCHSFASHP